MVDLELFIWIEKGELDVTSRAVIQKSRAQRNLGSGVLLRQVLELTLPFIAEQALFSIMGLLDAFWMGRVSEVALAAVTMGTTLRILLISPMMGLSAEAWPSWPGAVGPTIRVGWTTPPCKPFS